MGDYESENIKLKAKLNALSIMYCRDVGVMLSNYDWLVEVTGEEVDDYTDQQMIKIARESLRLHRKEMEVSQ